MIELINLNDVYTRTRLISYPCVMGQQRLSRRASTEDYQLILRLAFSQWGLPNRLATDHPNRLSGGLVAVSAVALA